MQGLLDEQKELLAEIEGFVGSVEAKIGQRERELVEGSNSRRGSGGAGVAAAAGGGGGGDDDPMHLLRFVFGSVERGLLEAADSIAAARDGVKELVLKDAEVLGLVGGGGSGAGRTGGQLGW